MLYQVDMFSIGIMLKDRHQQHTACRPLDLWLTPASLVAKSVGDSITSHRMAHAAEKLAFRQDLYCHAGAQHKSHKCKEPASKYGLDHSHFQRNGACEAKRWRQAS